MIQLENQAGRKLVYAAMILRETINARYLGKIVQEPTEWRGESESQSDQKCIYSILSNSVYKVTMKRFRIRGAWSLI